MKISEFRELVDSMLADPSIPFVDVTYDENGNVRSTVYGSSLSAESMKIINENVKLVFEEEGKDACKEAGILPYYYGILKIPKKNA